MSGPAMCTIWKYELSVVDVQRIIMPTGARLLAVAGQQVQEWGANTFRQAIAPMLWALVDPDAPGVDRLIAVVGTGNPAPSADEAVYVGTAICGQMVWHVFDGGEVPPPPHSAQDGTPRP